MTTTTSNEIKNEKKKRTNTLLVGTAGTSLNRQMMITATRLVSVVFDGDVNDFEHLCMLHCLSVMSGQCGSTAPI